MIANSDQSAFRLTAYLLKDGPAGFLLSWVAGFVDTAAFIILFGLFTAHVTGNLALAGSAFASEDEVSLYTHLMTIPTFMITVALTSLLAKVSRSLGFSVLGTLLAAEAIALAFFIYLGIRLSPALLLDIQQNLVLPIGLAGVVAMAIQNTLMKEAKGVFKSYIPTTVMTGNTTQFTIDLVELIFFLVSKQPDREASLTVVLERMSRTLPVLLGFVTGAAGAAYFISLADFASLSFPLIVTSILAVAAFIEHSHHPLT